MTLPIVLALFAVAVLLLALMAARPRLRRAQMAAEPPARPVAPEPAPTWLTELTPGELAELCLRLLSRMGYAMLAQTVEGDRAEVTATDDLSANGHRILLRAFAHVAGPLTRERLHEAIEHARNEGASRVIVVGVAGWTLDAEHAAQELPLELLDGADLAALTAQHLPELEQERHPTVPPPSPFAEHGPHVDA
ncbi:MAG: restriction endonuclease [Deltaproteobacteria bacterium]|nr:restriction endonuclease [Deltaproteobacteria bacterium]